LTLPAGVQLGDVYNIFDYEFGDQQTAESKYYVVMGYHKRHVAGFVTTSKEKGSRKRKEGCHAGVGNYPWNYYLQTRGKPFKDGTWVILQIEWQDPQNLATRVASGKAFRVLTFTDSQLRALRNCFEGSPEWADVCADFMYGGRTPKVAHSSDNNSGKNPR
jgi:hypothetical protein